MGTSKGILVYVCMCLAATKIVIVESRNAQDAVHLLLRDMLFADGNTGDGLIITGISSSGLVDDSVTVTVHYADNNVNRHTTRWSVHRKSNGIHHMDYSLIYGSSLSSRSSTVHINQFSSVYYVSATVFCVDDQVLARFALNMTAIQNRKWYPISRPNIVLDFNKTYGAKKNLDLEINVEVDRPHDEVENSLFPFSSAYFLFLKTNSDSPELTIKDAQSDALDIKLEKLTDDSTRLYIGLENTYANIGGMLIIPVMEDSSDNVLVSVLYAYAIKILSNTWNEVVPLNNVGVMHIPNKTIIYSDAALVCFAMGNPKPEVSIMRLYADGRTEIPPDTKVVFSTDEMSYKFLPLGGQEAGNYICRAKSGNKIVEKVTEAVIHQPTVFDESLTGVQQYNTDEELVTISCKASGNPKPRLSFSLDRSATPITSLSGVKLTKTEPDGNTEQITATFSPVGTGIYTVYCWAYQADIIGGVKRIDVTGPGNSFMRGV